MSNTSFLNLPSPIHTINLEDTIIDVKRDDLIHTLVTGNKWRKLKFILEDAKLKNKNHLVSFGGAFSNHLIALAVTGHQFGFETTGIVRGEEYIENEYLNICKQYGMNILQVSRNSYRDKLVLFNNLFTTNNNAYFIDEGGSHPAALQGVAEIIDEIEKQYDHIVLAVGTGTTLVGLINAIKNKKLQTKVHGVLVLKIETEKFIQSQFIFQYLHQDITIGKHYVLYDQFAEGGYAKTTNRLLNFIQQYQHTNDTVPIEPVYTGKAMYALQQMIAEKKIEGKILFLHTGGIF